MSDFKRCPTCNEYGWIDSDSAWLRHMCKPRWECRCNWEDDDCWSPIHASDAEQAAEKYAEHYDCEGGEYAIVSGDRDDVVILVRKSEDDPVESFSIEAETVPHYRASKMTETIG